jgi:uncharacterized protein with HEPN domain
MLLDSIVRQFAIVGEAPPPRGRAAASPRDPRDGVQGMRLWLEHEYHRVDAAVVWRTVTERLPELRRAIATELSP